MALAAPRSPFRADHVGSLLRPPKLKEARARAKRGEIGPEALRKVEDQCIRDVVAFQESVGLQGITDGEYRRDWWHIDFLRGFSSAHHGNKITVDDERRKLALALEVAQEVWGNA